MATTPAGAFVESLLDMAKRRDEFSKEEMAAQLKLAAQVLSQFLDADEKATIDLGSVDGNA